MNAEELKMQSDIFIHHWNMYPDDRMFLHANINNSSDRNKGALNMAIGVVAGVADLEYLCHNGKTLFIECKTLKGTQSEKQKEFQRKVESRGHRYEIIRTYEDGVELLRKAMHDE